jgi:hypothetical protein
VNGLTALPADGVEAQWIPAGDIDFAAGRADADYAERVTLRWENEAWTVAGRLDQHRVDYVVRLSPLWQVRQFLLFRDFDQPDLWLGTDGKGHWGEINGVHRPELDGALDVAVADAVFPHAVPIRRVPLEVGTATTLTVLTVDVETLEVAPIRYRYERLDERRWRVERIPPAAARADMVALDFDVDEHGLPLTIGTHRRSL